MTSQMKTLSQHGSTDCHPFLHQELFTTSVPNAWAVTVIATPSDTRRVPLMTPIYEVNPALLLVALVLSTYFKLYHKDTPVSCTDYRELSCQIFLCHILSYHVIYFYLISYIYFHVTSSTHIMPCTVMSYNGMECAILSCHVMSYHYS